MICTLSFLNVCSTHIVDQISFCVIDFGRALNMLRPASKLTGAFCHQSTKSRLNFNDKSIVLCPYPFLWQLDHFNEFLFDKTVHVKAQSITRCLFGHLRKFDVQQKVGGWKCFIFYLLQLCFVHICYSIFSYLLTCHVLFLFCQIITKTKNVFGTITSVVLHKHTYTYSLKWSSKLIFFKGKR